MPVCSEIALADMAADGPALPAEVRTADQKRQGNRYYLLQHSRVMPSCFQTTKPNPSASEEGEKGLPPAGRVGRRKLTALLIAEEDSEMTGEGRRWRKTEAAFPTLEDSWLSPISIPSQQTSSPMTTFVLEQKAAG